MSSPIRSDEDMKGIPAPDIPRHVKNDQGRIKYINRAQNETMMYAVAGRKRTKNAGIVFTPHEQAQTRARFETTDTLLFWLAQSVDINPVLRDECKLPGLLSAVQDPTLGFPRELQDQAKELEKKWKDLNWGAPAAPVAGERSQSTPDSDISDVEEDENGQLQSNAAEQTNAAGPKIHDPSPNHPVWGVSGIMHGLARKEHSPGKLSLVINPKYREPKQSPKVYGHNGLTPGQWFPYQLSALFHGAHGATQGGISGLTDKGAYSIVLGAAYADLNSDYGAVLYYSGPGSLDSEDPLHPPPSTIGTKCLEASIRKGKLVRVIRANSTSVHSPPVGLRYDGLYKVVSRHTAYNAAGGLYEQFRLERDGGEDNKTLDDCKLSPSTAQRSEYMKTKMQYW